MKHCTALSELHLMGAKLNDDIVFCHCEMVLLETDFEKMAGWADSFVISEQS